MIRTPLRLVPLALLAATSLLAQEGEGAEAAAPGPLDVNLGLMIWTIIIFVIVLVVLRKYAWPSILGAVEAREARIRELLSGAEKDRAAAAALLAEQEKQLAEARARVQEAFNEARTSAERMREEMMTAARREHEELLERARRDIAAERASALELLRRDAVDLALGAAERLVERNLNSEDDRRLVLEYLDRVEVRAAPVAAGV